MNRAVRRGADSADSAPLAPSHGQRSGSGPSGGGRNQPQPQRTSYARPASSEGPEFLAGLEPEQEASPRPTAPPLWQLIVGGCLLITVAVLVLDRELEVRALCPLPLRGFGNIAGL